ncbi:hypothetical protein E2C01_044061 [Portunus trituberculatus]|uniref:Uncharacterized protein n=1 Tax=Portunus trituberculatus TaxID=210409 RepID=A0A5B7FXT6_PORTR|nr:hypothetical protein [Portunus trituberculatus]
MRKPLPTITHYPLIIHSLVSGLNWNLCVSSSLLSFHVFHPRAFLSSLRPVSVLSFTTNTRLCKQSLRHPFSTSIPLPLKSSKQPSNPFLASPFSMTPHSTIHSLPINPTRLSLSSHKTSLLLLRLESCNLSSLQKSPCPAAFGYIKVAVGDQKASSSDPHTDNMKLALSTAPTRALSAVPVKVLAGSLRRPAGITWYEVFKLNIQPNNIVVRDTSGGRKLPPQTQTHDDNHETQ